MSDEYLNEKMEMIEECLEYMDRVVYQIDGLCENLRKKEKIVEIAQLSEGIMAVIRIVKYTESITKIKVEEEKIVGFIADMAPGVEKRDYKHVADIIDD